MLERTDLERTQSEILGRVEAGAQHLCADGRAKESGSERASARHVGLRQGLAAIEAVAWFDSSIGSHHSHDEGGELERSCGRWATEYDARSDRRSTTHMIGASRILF